MQEALLITYPHLVYTLHISELTEGYVGKSLANKKAEPTILSAQYVNKGRTLNTRQNLYKTNRLKGMNQYNAARSAGYSDRYSKQACRIEKLVEASISDSLERAGLTEKYQAEKIFKLTQATRPISCNVYIKQGEDGNYEMLKNADGLTKDFIEVDDNSIQLKALEHVSDLKKQKGPLIDQSTHITYAYIRNPKAVEERDTTPAPIQTR